MVNFFPAGRIVILTCLPLVKLLSTVQDNVLSRFWLADADADADVDAGSTTGVLSTGVLTVTAGVLNLATAFAVFDNMLRPDVDCGVFACMNNVVQRLPVHWCNISPCTPTVFLAIVRDA